MYSIGVLMQSFQEHMVEYLQSVIMDSYAIPSTHDLTEELNPGFKDRLAVYSENVDSYKETGDDALLISLLKEEFILSGMEDEAGIERMRRSLKRANETRRNWKAEDLKSKAS